MREARTNPSKSIRSAYQTLGVMRFYGESGATYRNPHEPIVADLLAHVAPAWSLDLSSVLDLAAGSGEVTVALQRLGGRHIDAIDPYTADAYAARTGLSAQRYSFADIAAGCLAGRHYALVVCSFALHLCERSRLPALAQQLSLIAPALLIITPHKRPMIKEEWGWRLTNETMISRVRARLYCAGS